MIFWDALFPLFSSILLPSLMDGALSGKVAGAFPREHGIGIEYRAPCPTTGTEIYAASAAVG